MSILFLDREHDLSKITVPTDDWVSSGLKYGGQIYLVREGLPDKGAVVSTLWHELLHYGLRRFLTREQYVQQMHTLDTACGIARAMK